MCKSDESVRQSCCATCTKENKESESGCAEPEPCTKDEKPKLRNGCKTCFKPKKEKCKKDKSKCDELLNDAPECKASTAGKAASSLFDEETCCYTCKRPGEKKDKCTKEDIKSCVDSDFTPVCEENEQTESDGQCCNRCKRGNHKTSLKDIGKCGKIPECTELEDPSTVDLSESDVGASNCKTCKKPKPKCAETCAQDQICAKNKDDDSTKCVSKKVKKFKMKAVEDAAKDLVEGATAEEVAAKRP